MPHRRRNFSKRLEHKAALVHGRVGQRELRTGLSGVAIQQQIEVDDAWTFGRSRGAIAAHGMLNRKKTVKQFKRRECCFEQSCGVYEIRLIEIADGSRGVKAGDSFNPAERGHAVQSFAKIGCGWAEG